VPDAHIHFEAFGPASVLRKQAETSAATMPRTQCDRMATSSSPSRSLVNSFRGNRAAGSLLAFAEANGIHGRLRLPGRRLRHLPDDHPRR
jgi:hypothetical protein